MPKGNYHLTKSGIDGHRYRLGHPLAQHAVSRALKRKLDGTHLVFDYSSWQQTAASLEPLVGKSGVLTVFKLFITGIDAQDHILFQAITDNGDSIDASTARRFFDLPIRSHKAEVVCDNANLHEEFVSQKSEILEKLASMQSAWFDEEIEKLDNWARDKQVGLKADLKGIDDQIKELKKNIRQTGTLPEKFALQRKVRKLESRREESWRIYDAAAREIEKEKDVFLDQVEGRMEHSVIEDCLFTIRWSVT